MTPEQITLVQESLRKVAPIAEAAAELFYARLFELDPNLRSLFRKDMKVQGHELMAMIAAAVNGLGNLEQLLPLVRELGVRHAGYGVLRKHYDTVGAALLWTLDRGLGADMTAETRRAWAAAYGLLAAAMIDAAYGPETPAAQA